MHIPFCSDSGRCRGGAGVGAGQQLNSAAPGCKRPVCLLSGRAHPRLAIRASAGAGAGNIHHLQESTDAITGLAKTASASAASEGHVHRGLGKTQAQCVLCCLLGGALCMCARRVLGWGAVECGVRVWIKVFV